MTAAITPAAAAVVEIEISQDPQVQPPADLDVRRCIELALASAECAGPSLGLRWVGSDESAKLNDRYRGKSGPTNVLAFPAPRLPGLPDAQAACLGDLVICVPVLESEAAGQGKTPAAHAAHLLVHGCLHLLGYDHDSTAAAERMERLETEVMATLGYDDPYRPRTHGVPDD